MQLVLPSFVGLSSEAACLGPLVSVVMGQPGTRGPSWSCMSEACLEAEVTVGRGYAGGEDEC